MHKLTGTNNYADNEKLQPYTGCIYKINNTKYRVKQYNGEDDIISLVPGFFGNFS